MWYHLDMKTETKKYININKINSLQKKCDEFLVRSKVYEAIGKKSTANILMHFADSCYEKMIKEYIPAINKRISECNGEHQKALKDASQALGSIVMECEDRLLDYYGGQHLERLFFEDFLPKYKAVILSYCNKHDDANVDSLSKDFVDSYIQNYQYWKNEDEKSFFKSSCESYANCFVKMQKILVLFNKWQKDEIALDLLKNFAEIEINRTVQIRYIQTKKVTTNNYLRSLSDKELLEQFKLNNLQQKSKDEIRDILQEFVNRTSNCGKENIPYVQFANLRGTEIAYYSVLKNIIYVGENVLKSLHNGIDDTNGYLLRMYIRHENDHSDKFNKLIMEYGCHKIDFESAILLAQFNMETYQKCLRTDSKVIYNNNITEKFAREKEINLAFEDLKIADDKEQIKGILTALFGTATNQYLITGEFDESNYNTNIFIDMYKDQMIDAVKEVSKKYKSMFPHHNADDIIKKQNALIEECKERLGKTVSEERAAEYVKRYSLISGAMEYPSRKKTEKVKALVDKLDHTQDINMTDSDFDTLYE